MSNQIDKMVFESPPIGSLLKNVFRNRFYYDFSLSFFLRYQPRYKLTNSKAEYTHLLMIGNIAAD